MKSNWEEVSETLKGIARTFPQESEQYRAVEVAAWAYLFVNMGPDQRKRFDEFRTSPNEHLTVEQVKKLRELGIEPW